MIAPGTKTSLKGSRPTLKSSEETKFLYLLVNAVYNNGSILSDIVTALGGSSSSTTITPGISKLTGSASFATTGSDYRSISMSVISLTTGTVTVTDSSGTTDVSYVGYNAAWTIDKSSDGYITPLTIATTGDAVIVITYTKVI